MNVLRYSSGADTIGGTVVSDTIYAGAGNDLITPYARVAGDDYGNDIVYGEAGRDTINYGFARSSVTLYGDGASASTGDGNDHLYAGSGNDTLIGGGGSDWLSGSTGQDVLYGDYQSGTTGGNDILIGGAGCDNLYGGAGHDYFLFNSGDSAPTYYGSDVIRDWNSLQDTIVISGGPAVTSNSYIEVQLHASSGSAATDFDYAAKVADAYLDAFDYIFMTNGTQGYLFADVNRDGTPDIGIEIKGATSLNDFSVADLLNNPASDFLIS